MAHISLKSCKTSGIDIDIDVENPETRLAVIQLCRGAMKFICDYKKIKVPEEDEISGRDCHRIVVSLNYAIEDIQKTKDRELLKKIRQLNRPESQFEFLRNVLATAKIMGIPDVGVLRGSSTGSCVYGEVNLHQMLSFVRELKIVSGSTFIDLGSGYGQLCCFVSAYTDVKKSIGIEILPHLHDAAVKHKNEFERMMKYFGKNLNTIELINGDMTNFKNMITEGKPVIFVNNLRFDSDLDFKLEKIFMKCNDGTRIISSKPLVTDSQYKKFHHWKPNSLVPRTESRLLKIVPENVSWCHNKSVPFFLTTINRNRAPFSR